MSSEKTASNSPDRRHFLRASAFGLIAAGSIRALGDDPAAEPQFLLRNRKPLDAETPPEVFRSWTTPNRLFFVRSHFGPPAEGLAAWSLEALGMNSVSWTRETLAKFAQITLPAVLQCSGNGRGYFAPKIPGVAWEKGAVGNAEWTGVRLRDLLESAGIRPSDKHVHLMGADTPPNPKTPAFFRSIPLERAMNPSTIVALAMNGEPLPLLHGGPARLVVPGWAGNHWIKWLRTITLAEDEAPGFYQRTGYRMPRQPVAPGAVVKPEDLLPVMMLNVKSLFANPVDGAKLKAGTQQLEGVAWTGPGRVVKVEVAVDDAAWSPAELHGADFEGSWRPWKFPWNATIGKHRLRVRATDSRGEIQPETTPWNKSGYLWNGIDVIHCEVV